MEKCSINEVSFDIRHKSNVTCLHRFDSSCCSATSRAAVILWADMLSLRVDVFFQSKPTTPTSAPDEGDIFSEEGSYIRTDVHHTTNGLHSDEELDLFTGISPCTIAHNEPINT